MGGRTYADETTLGVGSSEGRLVADLWPQIAGPSNLPKLRNRAPLSGHRLSPRRLGVVERTPFEVRNRGRGVAILSGSVRCDWWQLLPLSTSWVVRALSVITLHGRLPLDGWVSVVRRLRRVGRGWR